MARIRVCSQSGCGRLTESTYCETHRKEKRRASDSRRPNARARGYGRTHQRDRVDYFTVFPNCEWPGCDQLATDLDHVDGNPENRAWTNYRGYCHSHHSQRTARDQPGGFNARR